MLVGATLGLPGAKREPEGHKISFDDQTTRKLFMVYVFLPQLNFWLNRSSSYGDKGWGGGITQSPPPSSDGL